MRFASRMLLVLVFMALLPGAAAKPRKHTVFLGQWHTIKTPSDSGKAGQLRVRQLWIDETLKEYTSGPVHSITDRVFVIRRAYRVNDALPENKDRKPRWIWRLGGWISVDRSTGHVAQLTLPVFDAETSEASWYRDYAAYCGTSEDGSQTYLVIWQFGKKKPLLRKEFPGAGCPAPLWERSPSRVTFLTGEGKNTFVVDALREEPAEMHEGDVPR
jgi:hypothetical protein